MARFPPVATGTAVLGRTPHRAGRPGDLRHHPDEPRWSHLPDGADRLSVLADPGHPGRLRDADVVHAAATLLLRRHRGGDGCLLPDRGQPRWVLHRAAPGHGGERAGLRLGPGPQPGTSCRRERDGHPAGWASRGDTPRRRVDAAAPGGAHHRATDRHVAPTAQSAPRDGSGGPGGNRRHRHHAGPAGGRAGRWPLPPAPSGSAAVRGPAGADHHLHGRVARGPWGATGTRGASLPGADEGRVSTWSTPVRSGRSEPHAVRQSGPHAVRDARGNLLTDLLDGVTSLFTGDDSDAGTAAARGNPARSSKASPTPEPILSRPVVGSGARPGPSTTVPAQGSTSPLRRNPPGPAGEPAESRFRALRSGSRSASRYRGSPPNRDSRR